MIALLWKDYRFLQRLLLLAALLCIAPHFVGLAAAFSEGYAENQIRTSIYYSYATSIVVLPLVAAIAVGKERESQTLQFLDICAPSRRAILLSKLFWCVMLIVGAFIVNLSAMALAYFVMTLRATPRFPFDSQTLSIVLLFTVTGFMQQGVAWLSESMTRNSPFSILFGIACPLVIWCPLVILVLYRVIDPFIFLTSYGLFAVALGLVSFYLGCRRLTYQEW